MKFLVIKDWNGFEVGDVYKECFSTDGKNRRYNTKGLGDIVFGNLRTKPDVFSQIL